MNTYFAICPRGLEELLSDELRALGAEELRATHGGVFFAGDWGTCYRANLESRIATIDAPVSMAAALPRLCE